MTLSLLGRCERTGAMGMVIASSSPAVAARCAFAQGGVGVAASQNVTDPRLGPALLARLEAGDDPQEAVRTTLAAAPHAEFRQLALLDASGRGAAASGTRTLGVHATRADRGCVAAGNLLASALVVDALVDAFVGAPDEPLGDRLLRALEAGLAAGGEAGPVQSAGLLMVADVPWPVADLRVDLHDDPLAELRRIWHAYAPQLEDYVARALDPRRAPAYGVPGEKPAR